MPKRRTKRAAERTRLDNSYDAVICGASFAGLTVARELAGARLGARPARVLLLDRYDVGERQTSACAAPTAWLEALGLEASIQQNFSDLVIHTPHTTVRYALPWSFSTFDYQELCFQLDRQNRAQFETATVLGCRSDAGSDGEAGAERDEVAPVVISTDRGEVSAPLVVDGLGWRRVLGSGSYQPPEAPLSRGLEVHPLGNGRDLEIWIDRTVVPAGYGWSFPAAEEVRVGVGSFDPHFHVKQPTVELAEKLNRDAIRYQGNWIPHRLRDATADGVFFVGDSAGHCLPLTAEGIRTAFYFGIACGRELRRVLEGRARRDTALRRYGGFSARHERDFRWLLRVQKIVPRVPPRLLATALNGIAAPRLIDWSFNHYLGIAHPAFAKLGRATVTEQPEQVLAA